MTHFRIRTLQLGVGNIALLVLLHAPCTCWAEEQAQAVQVKDTRKWSSIVKPPAHPTPKVVIFKKPGLWTYEKSIEEFRNRVRGEVRTINVDSHQRTPILSWLTRYQPGLIFAVGQSAYDLVNQARNIPVIHSFVFRRQDPAHHAIPVEIPARDVLLAFKAARPGIHAVGVVHGPATDPQLLTALAVAPELGIKLVVLRATSPTHAIRLMRKAIPRIDGLWLLPDLELLRPQVFQYALVLQSRLRIPLMGITRRHAEQGALLALDYDPHDVGSLAAHLANQILTGKDLTAPPLTPQLTINLSAAHGLGVDLKALRQMAVKVYR